MTCLESLSRYRLTKFVLLLMVTYCFGCDESQAFELVPFGATLNPQTDRVKDFTVKTDSPEPVAVEISVQSRGMNEAGEDILSEDGEEDFLIFPTQFVITRGQPQTVRVQWLGSDKDDPTLERAYRLIAEQVPVDLETSQKKRGGNIRIVLKYVSSLYVTPTDAASDLKIKSIGNDPKDPKNLLLTVENSGKKHTIVPKNDTLKVTVTTSTGETTILGHEDLVGFAGENILAGVTRKFSIAKPGKLTAATPTSATIAYKEPFDN